MRENLLYIFKNLTLMIVVCGVAVSALSVVPKTVQAGGIMPIDLSPNFGGRVLMSSTCSCTPGCILLYIGPPRGGYKMWCPTTITFMFWTIRPFRWQLGLEGVWVPCMRHAGWYCYAHGGGDYMIYTGTSFLD